MNADKVKKQGKKGDGIYVFIIVILVIFNILLIKHIQSDKLAGLKEYLTEYYYSQENLDGAMRKKLGDIYDEGSYGNFENYVYNLENEDGLYVVAFDDEATEYGGNILYYGATEEMRARNLFAVLRELDDIGAKKVYIHSPQKKGVGLAVYNRLIRAAGFEVVRL